MIEIEVSERLMDSGLVPQRDEQGEIVVIDERVVYEKAPKYHAQIKGKPGHWGCGRTMEEAVGALVKNIPNLILVRYLGKQAR